MKNIPKTCYLYWNGKPMSLLHLLTVVSFHKHNPDWEIVVRMTKADDSIDNGIHNPQYKPFVAKDYLPELYNLDYVKIIEDKEQLGGKAHSILVSDIWRREVLFENGGVYSDFDVIWLKPMNEFVNIDCKGDPSDFESIASFYQLTHGFHNVSNLISEKGSPYLLSLIKEAKGMHPPYGDQSFGTDMLNRLYPDWHSICLKYPRMIALKYETFYPYSTFALEQLFVADNLSNIRSKDVMCVHWFNGNELAKEYINYERYNFNCSMTSILKEEGLL